MKIQQQTVKSLDLLKLNFYWTTPYDFYAKSQAEELKYFTLDRSYLDVIDQYKSKMGVKS